MGRRGGQIEPARLAGLFEHFKSQHISASPAQKTVVVTNGKRLVTPGVNKTIIKYGVWNIPEYQRGGRILIRKILNSIKTVSLWVLNLRLWQLLIIAFFLAVVVVVVVLLWITFHTPGGESTKPESDTHIDDITTFDKPLEVFRAEWDIYGRFEKWPALLPLAKMSSMAYLSEVDCKQGFSQFGFDSIVPIGSPFNSQLAYVAKGKDVVVIVFRGTDETEDGFFDVNAYPRHMKEGVLHSGFANAYSTLQSGVWQEIEKYKPKHIWITGHSLGGAIALVCAYDLSVYRDCKIDGVITFGQPKICTQVLADFLQQKLGDRYVHFVNELDGVPHLPPLPYSHCGLLLQFLNGEVKKSSDYFRLEAKSHKMESEPREDDYVPIDQLPEMSQKEYEEFMKSYKREKQALPLPVANSPLSYSSPLTYGIPFPWKVDHSMEHYVEKIRKAIDKAKGHY